MLSLSQPDRSGILWQIICVIWLLDLTGLSVSYYYYYYYIIILVCTLLGAMYRVHWRCNCALYKFAIFTYLLYLPVLDRVCGFLRMRM